MAGLGCGWDTGEHEALAPASSRGGARSGRDGVELRSGRLPQCPRPPAARPAAPQPGAGAIGACLPWSRRCLQTLGATFGRPCTRTGDSASVAWKSGHGALSLGGFPGARSWRALSLASHSLARERPAGRGEGPRAGPGAAGEAEAPTSQAPATRGLGHKKGASGHWVSASPAPHLLGRILGKPGPWDLGKALRRQFGQTPAGPPSCFRDAATRWRAIPDRVRRRSEGPTETKLNGSLVWKP